MRVLMTGHSGYLGSVMAPHFQAAGHEVFGLDTDYFAPCSIVEAPSLPATLRDLRELEPSDVAGYDAIVHLGALSNDPIGNLNDAWTEQINFQASVRLAELAKEAGVRRFLFSSSCIMYGMSAAEVVDEDSPLAPQTEYARSKVKAEDAIRELADDSFSPSYLRNGTVYGLSPRMRFDTVLNDLVTQGLTSGTILIQGDGTPWRPVVHVEDVAGAFLTVLEAPLETIHNQAFNTGADHFNHTVRELAEIAGEVTGADVQILGSEAADKRTYKASFAKFAGAFPDHRWVFDGRSGAADLADRLRAAGVTSEDYTGDRYVRLRWLNRLMSTGQLDPSLRWTEQQVPA